MPAPRALLPLALSLATLAAPAAAPVAAQPPPADAAAASLLAGFVRDATTVTALPWQREALGLSADQAAALRDLASAHQPTLQELSEELRMLFENVAMLDRPVDADEALALYRDIAAHKAEALMTFHAAAEAMLAVLTPEQRAAWAAVLEAAPPD